MLAPRELLAPYLTRSADLEHALDIARGLEISREAATRRYIDLHPECVAAVFSLNGRVRYIEKPDGFPMTGPWSGSGLGQIPSQPRDGTDLTGLDEVDAESWLRQPDRYQLFAQTLYQQHGYATTLLVTEPATVASDDWEPPVLRRSSRRR